MRAAERQMAPSRAAVAVRSNFPVVPGQLPGATDRYTYTVTGTFKRKRVKGTFQEKDDIYDNAGNLYGSCKTSGVTYKAKRQVRKSTA